MSRYIIRDQPMVVWTGEVALDAILTVPAETPGIVLIAGLASTTSQPGYRHLASLLNRSEFGTLLADLLTPEEQQFDSRTGHFRLDIPLLARRVKGIVRWVERSDETRDLPVAFFGTSVAGTAAVVAAAGGVDFYSLVLTSPRIDLALDAAHRLVAPVLLIQDADQFAVRALRTDEASLAAPHRLDIIAGAADVMREPASADAVASHAVGWYRVNAPQLVA
ncbi:MAG TPA: hydrolase [Thermoanaerobaculia bacterium]|nr:hydrolase [Thermoanaerobaculia bacterium]